MIGQKSSFLKNRSLIITLLVIAGGAYAAFRFFGGGIFAPQMPDAMPVSAAVVIEKPVTEWSEFSGRLRAVEDVAVRPRVSGVIETVYFTEGDQVQKGDKLFTLDLRPYKAAYSSAKARADMMSMEASRGTKLFADKAIAKRELDEKNAAAKEAQAALDVAELSLEYAEILSPITGRIGRPEITVGNMVDAGPSAPVLTTIQSIDPIYADFEIDEQTYLRMMESVQGEEGLKQIPVYLALANEKDFIRKGEIRSFDNQLSSTTGTLRVRASFPNENHTLTPGLFAQIRMGSAVETNALLVNEKVIGTDLNKKFVYVVKEDGTLDYRVLKLGGTADGLRIVKEGLKPGDRIVVGRLMMMMPGAKVMPQMVPMDTLAAPQEAAPAAGEQPKDAAQPKE